MRNKSDERHLIVEFNCPAENVDALKSALMEYVEPARKEDGCLYYDIYQNDEIPTQFYVLDGWRDQKSFDAHVASANVRRVRELIAPLVTSPAVIRKNSRITD